MDATVCVFEPCSDTSDSRPNAARNAHGNAHREQLFAAVHFVSDVHLGHERPAASSGSAML